MTLMVIKIGHYEHGPALTLKWKASHLRLMGKECPLLNNSEVSIDLSRSSNRTRRKKEEEDPHACLNDDFDRSHFKSCRSIPDLNPKH
ncbi:hypothetical protein NC652_013061 [Populus alba x Populus x berolinensis]|nr:hypothetical protein NC652_013061 [Populus alba x Populus x berolinensis]